MKVICEKNDLQDAVNIVSKAVASKAASPIMEGILLKTEENYLYFLGNNMEIAIECRIPAVIEETGCIVLESKFFNEIVRRLNNGSVTIYSDEQYNTVIQVMGLDYRIMGMAPDEYPGIPSVDQEKGFFVSSLLFKNMVKQTIFTIDENQSRKIMSGALVKYEKNKLSVVTASQNRLSIRHEMLEEEAKEPISFVVPGKTLGELLKIIKEDEDQLTIGLTSKYVVFEHSNFRLVSRLLEGEFLNYESFLPKEMKYQTVLDRAEILEKTGQCEPVVQSSTTMLIPVVYKFDLDTISIRAVTNTNSYMGIVSIANCEADFEIGFNYRFLYEALNAVEGDKVVFRLNNNRSPFLIEAEDSDRFIYMILPVILNNTN